MLYYYLNKNVPPDLDNIHIEVTKLGSLMTDKSIEWCRWDKDTEVLTIKFTNDLSPSDKLTLDDIVFNSS